jgi:hypothetical protein
MIDAPHAHPDRVHPPDPSLVNKVNGVYQFDITLSSGEVQKWAVDLKTGNCSSGLKEFALMQPSGI